MDYGDSDDPETLAKIRALMVPNHGTPIARLDAVIDKLASYWRYSQVVHWVMETYDVSDTTAEYDIANARRVMAALGQKDRGRRKEELREYLHRMAKVAEGKGDVAGAMAVARELQRLDGLHEATSVNVNVNATAEQELEKLVTAIADKLAADDDGD